MLVVQLFLNRIVDPDEDAVVDSTDVNKEGLMSSFAIFLLLWIVLHTARVGM
jgi:hypothetical protein